MIGRSEAAHKTTIMVASTLRSARGLCFLSLVCLVGFISFGGANANNYNLHADHGRYEDLHKRSIGGGAYGRDDDGPMNQATYLSKSLEQQAHMASLFQRHRRPQRQQRQYQSRSRSPAQPGALIRVMNERFCLHDRAYDLEKQVESLKAIFKLSLGKMIGCAIKGAVAVLYGKDQDFPEDCCALDALRLVDKCKGGNKPPSDKKDSSDRKGSSGANKTSKKPKGKSKSKGKAKGKGKGDGDKSSSKTTTAKPKKA